MDPEKLRATLVVLREFGLLERVQAVGEVKLGPGEPPPREPTEREIAAAAADEKAERLLAAGYSPEHVAAQVWPGNG